MFSHMFVCPWGVSVRGSLSRGFLSRVLCPGRVSVPGVSAQRDLCPGGLCPGGLCPGGVSVQGVSLQGVGVSIQSGLCPGGSLSGRPSPHMVTCGRYVSYWNAFLHLRSCFTSLMSLGHMLKYWIFNVFFITYSS